MKLIDNFWLCFYGEVVLAGRGIFILFIFLLGWGYSLFLTILSGEFKGDML